MWKYKTIDLITGEVMNEGSITSSNIRTWYPFNSLCSGRIYFSVILSRI